MKLHVLLPLAALAAVPSSLLTRHLVAGPTTPGPDDGQDHRDRIEALRDLAGDLDRLGARLDEQTGRLDALALGGPSPSGERSVTDEDIAEAVARRLAGRAARPEGAVAGSAGATGDSGDPPAGFGVRDMGLSDIVAVFLNSELHDLEHERFLQEVRDEGRIDELVRAIEERAAESPDDPDLQVSLGVAYLQKLFGLGQTPEVGLVAQQADLAFDRALALDERNWDARFIKAVALSNWPPVMGKVPEAVAHFEILIRQQEELPPNPKYAETYLFLGNMYEQIGEKEKALSTWRAGLSIYPEFEGFAARIRSLEG